jgi:hypothetical protein
LVGFDVAAETGLPGSQSQRAGQLVPIQRQTGLDAQAVTSGQANRLQPERLTGSQQRLPQRHGLVGMHI